MGLKTGEKKSDFLDVADLKKLVASPLWKAANPQALIRKFWFELTFWFIFRAQESTWIMLQCDLSLEIDSLGKRMLVFKDQRLSKMTSANAVTCQMPSVANQKKQRPRMCYDLELID
jgi:hypothetical protein